MASKIKEWDFTRRGTRGSKYPWDDWTDGSIWKLKHGEDFESQPQSMRSVAAAQADKRGLNVRVSVKEDDGIVVFQFYENGNKEK